MSENSRRQFLKWLIGLGGAAAAGYLLRGLVGDRPPAQELPTATPTLETPTLRPSATVTRTPSPATSTPTRATGTEEPTEESPPTQAPTPTPTPLPWVLPEGPSKLGLHTIDPNNAFPFVRDIRATGAHVSVVKALGGLGLLREVKQVSPETVTIGRVLGLEKVDVSSGNPSDVATYYMNHHMAGWANERDVTDYWEVINEVSPGTTEGHVWLAHFYSACMEIAEANGYRLALFSYPTGSPEWYHWAAIVETGVFAQAKAGGHILALHEGDWGLIRDTWGGSIPEQPNYDPERGVLSGRYRHLYRDFLIPRDEVIPLAMTEFAAIPEGNPEQQRFYWEQIWLREMAWYDSKMVEDDYVIGAAIFTLGGQGQWPKFDFEHMLPELKEYIIMLHERYG